MSAGRWSGAVRTPEPLARNRQRALIGTSGPEIYHSDDDRERALAQLDRDFTALRSDVEPRATAVDASPARAQWWTVDVLGTVEQWRAFRDRQSSWWARAATAWSTYEAWHARLRDLRTSARAQGLALRSAEPPPLPTTIFERGAAGLGSAGESVWTIGRALLYAAVGVTGVLTLHTAWRGLRREPGDRMTQTQQQSNTRREPASEGST